MGLPDISIEFRTRGLTAVKRSRKGVVALILKDDTKPAQLTTVYNSSTEVEAEDWTEENLNYIKMAFRGIPRRLIVERIATTATDYNDALNRLKNKRWNRMAVPGIAQEDVEDIATFIKEQRSVNKKTFKAVLPHSLADDMGIENYTTEDNKTTDGQFYTASQFTARIAGEISGIPIDRSATYEVLTDVVSVRNHADPDGNIDNGQLILINDGEKIKIGRGINSKTTVTAVEGKEFKKIRVVESVDLMLDDIRDVFNDHYVGKVVNIYDNKLLFIAAVNAYFKLLEGDYILDPEYGNKAAIDLEAQTNYLKSEGYLTSDGRAVEDMTEEEILKANTDDKVFIAANVKFTDTMEDLGFKIYL